MSAAHHCPSCWWLSLRDAQWSGRPRLDVYRDLVTATHSDHRRVARELISDAMDVR